MRRRPSGTASALKKSTPLLHAIAGVVHGSSEGVVANIGREAMERSPSGLAELLTLVALLVSPLLYDFSQWVQHALGG